MSFRNIAMIAASGLMLATPLAAQAATARPATAKAANTTCKGLHGKALKTCKQDAKKTK